MKTLQLLTLAFIMVACAVGSPAIAADEPNTTVVLASQVKWEHLNPARGDKAPSAGTLWGDRSGTGPTGFLLRPSDGFESPPHTHNVSYRALVIRGLIHNDDPKAVDMWMPAGSFWTQPAGEVHITAAKGTDTLAYVEIEAGPYLVLPTEKAFDNGERPVNVDETNIVWLDASNITWVAQPGAPAANAGPQVAFLWGSNQDGHLNGTLVKLPAGFSGTITGHGATFRAVVIQGSPELQVPGKPDAMSLEPGSYFASTGGATHQVSCEAGGECVIYIRAEGRYDVRSVKFAK